MSLPLRERGLKCYGKNMDGLSYTVAPLAGAWIEISALSYITSLPGVAPLAGAWIEIF